MRVKLLKKLRKRFTWKKVDYTNAWICYDRELNEEWMSFHLGIKSFDEMLMLDMMRRMGMKYEFPVWRNQRRRNLIYKKRLKQQYAVS